MKKRSGARVAVGIVCAAAAALAAVFAADALWGGSYERSAAMMNTVVSVSLQGRGSQVAGEDILRRIGELENRELSRHVATSTVSEINELAGDFVTPSVFSHQYGGGESGAEPTFAQIIARCERLGELSGGAFNILLGRVIDLWDFDAESAVVPDSGELERAARAASGVIQTQGDAFKIPAGTQLDLGAVGKGVACDHARAALLDSKVRRAVVSVGGSVLLYGRGEFKVGVRNPFGGRSDTAGVLTLGAGCVSTSGSYERGFDFEGVRYHHILSPESGWPVNNGLVSVTVFCDGGLESDALSTACFVLGYEDSVRLLAGYGAEAMFVFEDKRIAFTGGLESKFELTDDSFTIERAGG